MIFLRGVSKMKYLPEATEKCNFADNCKILFEMFSLSLRAILTTNYDMALADIIFIFDML